MMNKYAKNSLALLRASLGWLMLYAGLEKLLDPSWSAAGYLNNAATFPGLFHWFAQPGILPVINFVNEWGLTLLGISLILGLFVRLSSILGAGLMLLYYFPVLNFPHIPPHSFIVDEHIIYALVLAYFAAAQAGKHYSLYNWCAGLPICSKFPKLRNWLG